MFILYNYSKIQYYDSAEGFRTKGFRRTRTYIDANITLYKSIKRRGNLNNGRRPAMPCRRTNGLYT